MNLPELKYKGRIALFTLMLTLFPGLLPAATLNVVGGQLMGASGVNVNGGLYQVSFLDGSCIGLYDGCNSNADFTFNSAADAQLASQALLDQVFLDGGLGQFDSDPELINGISNTSTSMIFTPFGYLGNSMVIAYNNAGMGGDNISLGGLETWEDTTGTAVWTYAKWDGAPTPIPIPPAIFLFISALVGLGFFSRGRG